MSARDFRFSPLERRAIWNKLALTMSQASALTGASERQIQHWMDRGYVQLATKGTRRLNGDGIDLILLILQARDAGIPLKDAVALAGSYQKNEAALVGDFQLGSTILSNLHERLAGVRDDVEAIRLVVQNVKGS